VKQGAVQRRITPFLFLLLLAACQQPSGDFPPAETDAREYIDWLNRPYSLEKIPGNPHPAGVSRADLNRYFFLPLRPGTLRALQEGVQRTRQQLREDKRPVRLQSLRQKGRWAVAILDFAPQASLPKGIRDKEGADRQQVLWLFFYKNRWRVIAPPLYKSKEVLSMMNLYPEHQELNRWLLRTLKAGK